MAKSNVVGKIVAALKTAKAPSTPWFAGTLSSTEVGLEIEQVGEVELPLRPAGLRKLCEVASQTPYGKRTDTIVDANVRDTLQVGAEVIKYSAEFAAAERTVGLRPRTSIHRSRTDAEPAQGGGQNALPPA